jgi:hypothetical protein
VGKWVSGEMGRSVMLAAGVRVFVIIIELEVFSSQKGSRLFGRNQIIEVGNA